MSLGSDLAGVALAQIAEFGRTITYNRINNGSYNTNTSSFAQGTTSFTMKAIVEEDRDEGKEVTLAAVSTKKMTAAASSFGGTAPTLVDTVTVGAAVFVINDIDVITVNDVVVVYAFNLRKG